MGRWHGKHPIPWDYFNSFSNASGKDLTWFFQNWFFTNYYIDLAVEKVDQSKKKPSVTIQNIGGFAVPVDVRVTYTDGSNEVLHQTPAIWQANQRRATVPLNAKKTVKAIELAGGIFMDANGKDNKWAVK